jgi:hypothetical protein
MSSAGIMGSVTVGKKGKVIEVEDKEKMRDFEKKLEREKMELKAKAEQERN